MKKKTVLCAIIAAAFAAEAALTSTWTGAESGSWTNAANWTAGVPGQYVVAGGVTNGEAGCTAIFTAVGAGAATTIDLDGLVGIKFLTVKGADAPQYTFGKSSTQLLPMEGWGGKLLVESSVTTPPLLTCRLGLGLQIEANMDTYIENNASSALVINEFGYWTKSISSAPTVNIRFSGSGPVRLAGNSKEFTGVYAYYKFYLDGLGDLEIATDTFTSSRRLSLLFVPAHADKPNATNVVRIATGCHFLVNQAASTGITAQGNILFTGDGYLQLRGGTYANNLHSTAINVSAGKTVEIASRCDGILASSGSPTVCGLVATGQGRTILTGPNELAGRIDVIGNATTLETGSIGLKGASSTLGTGDAIRLSGNSRLLYTGAGETTDREIQLGTYTAAGGIIEHAGSGTLTFASVVTQTAANITLSLCNDTAYDAIWSGNLADNPYSMNVSKRGSGRWILTGANTYSGTTTLAEGTLRLAAGGSLASAVTFTDGTVLEAVAGAGGMTGSLSLVAPASGTATLSVEGSGTVSVSSLSGSAGVLNVVADPATVSVVFTGVSAGGAPRYLLFNGEAAAFDNAGRLVVRSFMPTDEIAARGGVIPNGADKSVAIVSAGTSGPITLENGADATIASLGQLSGTDAVVSLAGGRTLALSSLFLDENAAGLSIGTVPGEGTLAASGGDFSLENKSASSVLEVNAALSVPPAADIVKEGVGAVRIASSFDHAGGLVLRAGSFAVSNAATFAAHLYGSGTFVKEGGESWSFSAAQPDFSGDFVLAGGYSYLVANGVFGDTAGRLVVTNGATLDLSNQFGDRLIRMQFGAKEVALSGEGVNGMGAIRFGKSGGTDSSDGSSSTAFKRLSLLGDTLICVTNTAGGLGLSGSADDPFVFDMNGHSLVKRGGGGLVFQNGAVTNPGPIRIESDIAGAYGDIRLLPGANLGGDASVPLTLATRANLFGNCFPPQRRKLVVEGPDVRVSYSAASHNMTTNFCNWVGPVVLSNSLNVILRSNSTDPFDFMLTLSGPVSGPNGIAVSKRARLFLANENNTFEGTLSLAGVDGGTLRARYPGSIPDVSKVTVNGGRLAVCAPHWTASDIAELATNATFSTSYSFLSVNTEDAENQCWTLAPGNTLTASGLSHEGEGTLTVVGPITEPLRYASHGGTLKFSGAEPILLGFGVLCQDPNETNDAVVAFEDAADIRMDNTSSTMQARIGVNWSSAIGQGRSFGRLRVRNARVTRNTFEESGSVTSGFVVGNTGQGILEVENGAFITNLVQVASGASSIGAIYMRGGELYNWSTETSSTDVGIRGSAYLEVASGNYICGCATTGVGRFGDSHSVVNVCGGRLLNTGVAATSAASKSLIVGRQGHGHLRVAHGVFQSSASTYICESGESYSGASGVITLEGDGEVTCSAGVHLANQVHSTAIVNLNGGVLAATYVRGYGPTREGATSYVNCSGGTFKLGSSSNSAFQDVTRVTLYEGGLTIDTDGKNRLVNETLCAPSGNGVTAIPSGWWGVTNYVGSPYVEIIGSGTGASAYADFDSARGEVTAIRVVSPGCGYGSDTKAVLYWGALVLTNAVSVGPVAGGGFTKKGAGTLTLNATNEYVGATTVSDGTLKLGCDLAIPSNSVVSVAAGATLDVNGKAFAPGGVSGGGTVAGNVAMPTEWTIDLADAIAGVHPAFSGTVTFPEDAKITILNADLADKAVRRYVLAEVASVSGTLPVAVDADGQPLKKWRIVASGGQLKLSYLAGAAVSFR